MPVFELEGTRRGRWRAFLRAQLPLLLGTLFVTVEGLWAVASVASSTSAVFGVAVIVATSGLFVALPWENWPATAMLVLVGLDVLGVAFLRLAYFDVLPTVGLLVVFPVIWLAYAFRRRMILLAVFAALFVTLLPIIESGRFPSTALGVASVITLPVLVSGLAVAVSEAARQLSGSQRRIHHTNLELQEALRRSEDSEVLARTIFESVDVAMAFFDTDRRLVMGNALASHAVAAAGFSLDREPYAGAEVRRADNQTPIPLEEQIIPRALRGDLHNHQMEWIGPDGNQIAVIATAQQVLRSDGQLWGTLIAAHNVTDLARSIQVKEEFVATVSHELRTPLTSIIGYLEIVTEDLAALDDQPRHITAALATIRRSALKLQERIKELLDTADRRRELNLIPCDLTTIIDRVHKTFAEQARTRGITLIKHPSAPCWVTADPAKIEQAVENLVSNAIKYTPNPGEVTFDLIDTRETAQLRVSDTGVGMTPDELDQAFTTFWRAKSARDQAIQGIGIGLTLVREIIDAHRGDVAIASRPGLGTSVTITIPKRS